MYYHQAMQQDDADEFVGALALVSEMKERKFRVI